MSFSANLIYNDRGTGLKGPDRHDSRDYLFALNAHKFDLQAARPQESFLEKTPPVLDQGRVGSCAPFSVDSMREGLTLKFGHTLQPFSRLWTYWNTRERFYPAEVLEDTGCYMRDVIKIGAGRGFALEKDWTYENEETKFRQKPPSAAYGPALWYRNVNAYRLQSLNEMLDCLAAKWGFVFGFPVYPNFYESAGHGRVPMPGGGGQLGGHAQYAVGYKFESGWAGGGYIEAINSWGSGPTGFTLDGRLRFPFEFMARPDILWDVWTMHLKAEDEPAVAA